jgi:hypothetical protein
MQHRNGHARCAGKLERGSAAAKSSRKSTETHVSRGFDSNGWSQASPLDGIVDANI